MSERIPRARAGRGPVLRLLAALLSTSCAGEPIPSPGWEAEPEVLSAVEARGLPRAGAARLPLDPPYAVPMAGYAGASFIDLRSLRDPLLVRAIVLEAGGLRIALVSVDRVLVPPGLRAAVEAREEFGASGVKEWILGATHTHTAPGGHVESWPAELFGTGAFDPLVLEDLAGRIAGAIAAAARDLEPCRVEASSGEIPPAEAEWMSFNRRSPGSPTDRGIDAIRFIRPSPGRGGEGAPGVIATWFRYSAHPTLIPFYLRRSSGDYPGVACRLLEKETGGTALFANGASADIAAGAPADAAPVGWERRVERIGRRLAANVARLVSGAGVVDGGPRELAMSFIRARVRLPPRRPWGIPLAGRAIAAAYPEAALFQALRIDGALILTFPGELEHALGEDIRAAARASSGARGVTLWTLTDEYIGYAFSREALEAGGKGVHLAVYGPEMETLLGERMAFLAARCRGAGGARTEDRKEKAPE